MKEQRKFIEIASYLFFTSAASLFFTIFSWYFFPWNIFFIPIIYIFFGLLLISIIGGKNEYSFHDALPHHVIIYFLLPVLSSFVFFSFLDFWPFEDLINHVDSPLFKYSLLPDLYSNFSRNSEMYINSPSRKSHLILILIFSYSAPALCSFQMYYISIRIEKSIYKHILSVGALRVVLVSTFVLILSIFATYEMFKSVGGCIDSRTFGISDSMLNICEAYARGGAVFYLHISIRIISVPLIFVLVIAARCHLRKLLDLKVRKEN